MKLNDDQMCFAEIKKRDTYIRQIETKLKDIRKRLKTQGLAKQSGGGDSGGGSRDDYTNYHHYSVKQKEDQLKALEILYQYLADLITSTDMTTNNIKDAIIEQNKVSREILKIKKN